ncbi:MAG: YjfB family protein [Lachnospiraceae bacterium]|nr:YjfB family protein [Lachnospiraceae bacterium]
MDIAQLSTTLSSIETLSGVSTAVLAQSLDTQESLGENLTKMMEQSVEPAKGANIDVSV